MAVQTLGNLKRVCILSDLDDAVAEIDRFAPILRDPIKIEDLKGRTTALREPIPRPRERILSASRPG